MTTTKIMTTIIGGKPMTQFNNELKFIFSYEEIADIATKILEEVEQEKKLSDKWGTIKTLTHEQRGEYACDKCKYKDYEADSGPCDHCALLCSEYYTY